MTTSISNVIVQESLWQVQGPMGFSAVEHLLAVTEPHWKRLSTQLVIDLAQVTEVDSASISLLMEWQRQARAQKCALVFKQLPANLSALAEVYGVQELIPVAN